MGRASRSPGIREVEGGGDAATALFNELRGGNAAFEVRPGVFVSQVEGGGNVTLRLSSKSGPPTVDVHGVADGVRKIKFVGPGN